jgi:uncharacterized membrane protein
MSEDTPKNPNNGKGLAVASMVLGILAFVGHWCCCGGLLFAILAIIFGVCAKGVMRRTGDYDGSGMATAGIILGIIDLVLSLLVMLVLLLIFVGVPCAAAGIFHCV